MRQEFFYVLLFFLAGLGLVTLTLSFSKFLRKDKPNPEKNDTYESGEKTEGSSQVAFNIKFYVIAIVFLLFEAEIILMFPWAVVFSDKTMLNVLGKDWLIYTSIEIGIFLFLLVLGLAYVWKEGHIDWIKAKPKENKRPWPVDKEKYATFNQKYT